jgi:hypothetical protein
MPVPLSITQTAGDNQHIENHHRYDCEWNQVLHTYLLSGFDNPVIFPAQPYLFFNAMHVYEVRPRKDKRGVAAISDALPFIIALIAVRSDAHFTKSTRAATIAALI